MRFFPGSYSDTSRFVTPPGSRVLIHHEARFNGERTVIVESGRSDIQDAINSFAPYCDITYMLSRLKVGDSSVLNPVSPMFGDFSGLPSNPHDILNIVRSAESSFSRLPSEERKAYNNDFRVWLSRSLRPGFRPAGSSAAVQSDSTADSVKEV